MKSLLMFLACSAVLVSAQMAVASETHLVPDADTPWLSWA